MPVFRVPFAERVEGRFYDITEARFIDGPTVLHLYFRFVWPWKLKALDYEGKSKWFPFVVWQWIAE